MIAGTQWERAHALEQALAIAREAAAIIMRVYAAPFDVDYKGPNDPVTRADREANALICARLSALFPGVPIVAEESEPESYAGFGAAPAAWFVDPLDGTRDFVAKNGQFAVMIGLAEKGRATGGVIVCPALGRAYVGGEGVPAIEVTDDGTKRRIQVSDVATVREASFVISRSRRPRVLDQVLAELTAGGPPLKVTPMGSSGLKGSTVAAGEADVYLAPGTAGKRWDACATDAIVRAAGGTFSTASGAPYEYSSGQLDNVGGFVATNTRLHDTVLAAIAKVTVR